MAIRIVEGIFEGVTFPCIHAVFSKWAPPHERSRSNKTIAFHLTKIILITFVCPVATISFAGAYAGTVVSMPLSGILASTWGWESLFYFFGKFWLLVVMNVVFFIAVELNT